MCKRLHEYHESSSKEEPLQLDQYSATMLLKDELHCISLEGSPAWSDLGGSLVGAILANWFAS